MLSLSSRTPEEQTQMKTSTKLLLLSVYIQVSGFLAYSYIAKELILLFAVAYFFTIYLFLVCLVEE